MTFDEAYRQYFNQIYQRCLYALLFDEAQAYQVAQDVFVLLWERWSSVPEDRLEGWLRKTAKYKIYKLRADHTKAQRLLSLDEDIAAGCTQTTDVVDEIIDQKVSRNPELYTEQVYARLEPEEIALAGYIRQGRSQREIAQLMNATEGAVSMRVTRLRRKVEKIVREIIESVL